MHISRDVHEQYRKGFIGHFIILYPEIGPEVIMTMPQPCEPRAASLTNLVEYSPNKRVIFSMTIKLNSQDGESVLAVVVFDLLANRQLVLRLSDGVRIRCRRIKAPI